MKNLDKIKSLLKNLDKGDLFQDSHIQKMVDLYQIFKFKDG